jgi:hypothetical protein
MLTRIRIALAVLLAFILLVVLTGGALAQTPPAEQFFPETGHTVKADFLNFYRSTSEAQLLFGYPITEAYVDPLTNQLVQYFQRARFDLVAVQNGSEVHLAPLGELLHDDSGQPAAISNDSATCRNFPETGKNVCYAFLQFYDAHNGPVYFGNPVSDVEVLNDHYVQYFQRARMEWRPEAPDGFHVTLSDLGSLYYDKIVKNSQWSSPQQTDGLGQIVEMRAFAFVTQALLAANSQQNLYIIVYNQQYQPVSQAMVSVTVIFPDGHTELYRPPLTNGDGISQMAFSIGDVPIKEIVQVKVKVAAQNVEADTSTWFRIWW